MLLHPASPKERIEAALGASFKNDLIPVNRENGGLYAAGYIGKPFSARPNRSGQYLFLNGRPIQSPFISWTIKEAYSTHLPSNRHPPFVLWLTVPPEVVDVNVHPQKKEVRFRDEGEIRRTLFMATQEALAFREEEKCPPASFSTYQPLPWEPMATETDPPVQPTLFEFIKTGEEKPPEARILSTLKGFVIAEMPGKEGNLSH